MFIMHSQIATYTTARLFIQQQYVHQQSQVVLIGENPSYRIRPPAPNDPLYTDSTTILPREPNWCSNVRAQLSGAVVTHLVSDASAKQNPAPCSSVFDPNTGTHSVQACVTIASSSFVPFEHPPLAYVVVTGIPKEARAYDGELMGTVCLLTLRRFLDSPPGTLQAGLDCKAVIQNTGIGPPQIRRRTQRVEPDEQLELSCRHLHVLTQPRIVHIPAHLDAPKFVKGKLRRAPTPRKDWSKLSLLQEIADILADPQPSSRQLASLAFMHHMPPRRITVDATELVAGTMTSGFWWWVGLNPTATLLCSLPDLYRYLRQRQLRTIHRIPWESARLGLLNAMLCKHQDWKYLRLRALLMRYLWDYLPHGRTFSKNEGDIIPPCPLCGLDIDDLHHMLVECLHPSIKALRLSYLAKALQGLRRTPHVSPPVVAYAKTLTRLLAIPDPNRLSHAIWLGRPFFATLEAADHLMPQPHYHSSILSQLTFHLPTFLLALFEGVIDIWKTRCKLIHPPKPLPLVRISSKSLRHLRKRQRTIRTFLSPTQSQQSSIPSSMPTPSSAQFSVTSTPSHDASHLSQILTPSDLMDDPVPALSEETVFHMPNICLHSTYIPVVLLCPLSPHHNMRSTDLEAAAAQPPPLGADNSPSPSIK